MVGITFTGHLVFASKLSKSTAYDSRIYHDSRHLHPQFDWEQNIGDGHFSTTPQFFVPAARTNGRALTPTEITWNEWIQLVRARIEHLNNVFKNHRMFKGEPFRGKAESLKLFVNISLHGAAVEIRARSRRDGPRYPGYGPWAHCYLKSQRNKLQKLIGDQRYETDTDGGVKARLREGWGRRT